MRTFLILLSAATCLLSTASAGVTQAMVEEARAKIVELYEDDDGGALYTNVLRLTFHDCIGKCDGCVNLAEGHNKGLRPSVCALDALFKELTENGSELSRADLIALAGITAVQTGIEKANEVCEVSGGSDSCRVPDLTTEFVWGREDCPDSFSTGSINSKAPTKRNFAETHFTHDELVEYFQEPSGFNFTAQEITALFGAHTMGEARPDQSGYNGPWVQGEVTGASNSKIKEKRIFNNEYYKRFLDESITWKAVKQDVTTIPTSMRKVFMWKSEPDVGMNLNVDFSLYVNDAFGQCARVPRRAGRISGGKRRFERERSTCEETESAADIERYAGSNEEFLKDFSAVYQKTLANGYAAGELKPVEE